MQNPVTSTGPLILSSFSAWPKSVHRLLTDFLFSEHLSFYDRQDIPQR